MANHLHRGDLPEGLSFGNIVAIDTESMGLHPGRDRLCVVQLSAGDGDCHLVQFPNKPLQGGPFQAPNLKKILEDQNVIKLFHYARGDIAMLKSWLGAVAAPVYCTKIASKLVRTFAPQHGLKSLCKDLLGIDLNKQFQTSDWGADTLTAEQLDYAASDVLYLHQLKTRLDALLQREGRTELAQACFAFLPARALLDLAGWEAEDIFAH